MAPVESSAENISFSAFTARIKGGIDELRLFLDIFNRLRHKYRRNSGDIRWKGLNIARWNRNPSFTSLFPCRLAPKRAGSVPWYLAVQSEAEYCEMEPESFFYSQPKAKWRLTATTWRVSRENASNIWKLFCFKTRRWTSPIFSGNIKYVSLHNASLLWNTKSHLFYLISAILITILTNFHRDPC